MTACTMAARAGHVKVLEVFREMGGLAVLALGDLDAKNWGILHYGIANGYIEVVRFVLFEVGFGQAEEKDMVTFLEEHMKDGKWDDSFRNEFKQLTKFKGKDYRLQRSAYFREQEKTRRGPEAKSKAKAEK